VSRADHEKKIRSRKGSIHIEKYSFVNRTIQLGNQLPADGLDLEALSCKPCDYRRRVRKVINQVKCMRSENHQKIQRREVKLS
jgi:hypothetical protein